MDEDLSCAAAQVAAEDVAGGQRPHVERGPGAERDALGLEVHGQRNRVREGLGPGGRGDAEAGDEADGEEQATNHDDPRLRAGGSSRPSRVL
jgi:hypothetical protein